MIDMKFAKFLIRFCNNMLPVYFNNYFENLKPECTAFQRGL